MTHEPANEHIRNALAILYTAQPLTEYDVKAVIQRLRKAVEILEHRDVNMPLSRRRRGRMIRRSNPALAILGNPRVEDATVATWAQIEYVRPDDPDGSKIVRVHEFPDGFEIGWLSDGSVQLSHPKHALWVEQDDD